MNGGRRRARARQERAFALRSPSSTPQSGVQTKTRRRAAFGLLLVVTLLPGRTAADDSIAIVGGTVHTLSGPPVENGTVIVRGETIAAVGGEVEVPAGARILDASGLVVVPGFFDAMSTIGLSEISSLSATQDTVELGAFNPHLLALEAVHPASEHIPVARANGVTHAGTSPAGSGYGIPGRASAIHLDGWTVEDMAIARDVGVVVTWPDLVTRRFDRATARFADRPFTEAKKEYDERVGEIRAWIDAARRYALAREAGAREAKGAPHAPPDLRLAGLADVVAGRLPLLVRAGDPRQIRDAVAFAGEESLRMILVGGRESSRVADLLAENEIPVILGPPQALPAREDDAYDSPYALASALRSAGVEFAISTFGASASFSLPYEAAQAVAFGLPWEDGLKAITTWPAQILGVADRLGTIEPGKIANLIVTDGDPLEIRTRVVHVLVRGQVVELETKHTRSYERWRSRPLPAKTE